MDLTAYQRNLLIECLQHTIYCEAELLSHVDSYDFDQLPELSLRIFSYTKLLRYFMTLCYDEFDDVHPFAGTFADLTPESEVDDG